jgi:hypothetical protein
MAREAMEGTLNYRGLRCYEASAATGRGVFDTLRGISELVLERLAERFRQPESAAR